MNRKAIVTAMLAAAVTAAPFSQAAGPARVEMTWMSIANWYFKANDKKILMDAYITRLPGKPFFYGPADRPNENYAWTTGSAGVDTESITKVKDAVLGNDKLDWMLVGHAHWDHSWDSPTWSKMTGAPMIGGLSACYQAQTQGVDAKNCMVVKGGEKISLGEGITIRVVRWNHSGDTTNPIQHFPRELDRPPVPDAKGWLRAGVGEDYPNGGGNRAFLFTVEGSDGPLNFFVNNSASAYDLDKDIVIDGVNYGAPIANLAAAMKDAGLTSLDAWIGTGGEAVAKIVVPVIKPKVYIPSHWDGLFNPFWPGMPFPYKDDALAGYLRGQNVALMPQKQYFDSYLLTRSGVTMEKNSAMKKKLGFSDEQAFKQSMLDAVRKVASTSIGDDCGEGFDAPPAWATLFAGVR